MSIITLPAGLPVETIGLGQQTYDLSFQAGDNGAAQTRMLAPPRWTCTLAVSLQLRAGEAADWKAMLLQLRGKVNQLAVYDVKHPVPAGTMGGAPVLAGAVAVGATAINITTTAGATLKKGDWIGLGSGQTRQLFAVMADATANGAGAMMVVLEPPSRYVQSIGSAVVWDKPTCLMRRTDTSTDWSASKSAEGSFQVNLLESWEP